MISACTSRSGLAPAILAAVAACFVCTSCQDPGPDGAAGSDQPDGLHPAPQLVALDGLGTVELIDLLAHPNELTRTRAHLQLRQFLVDETGHPDYADRLTRFQKFAPHACRAGNEAQTLHILGLFAAQQDISSILVKQCLGSSHSSVRATALELAHFSDNRIDATLLAFEPDRTTLASYKVALRKLDTPESAERLAALD